ncbi:hypothetical protein A374_14150 [Fictibacillus macauensis ZFHKF-1]|uniref:Transporter family-2 protein n=1 Tax=Fictibacillus macauensis ZFHKF-1 TaxID=1196324 RepID=I8UD37_9BACL|nr:DMT family transporter [Fictibacillus macauensis]EIT84840.1 hypothetical protein A374_14150 [Fictibacillus macauensis ZFHKF-1]
MKGILFAILGGICITVQGVANSQIGAGIGTWQAATLTQFTGFVAAFILMLLFRDNSWKRFKDVKPLYLMGGTFAAIVIFSNVTAIHLIGITISISALLIAQLAIAFLTDRFGWFEVEKKKMRPGHFVGIGLMMLGVLILSM